MVKSVNASWWVQRWSELHPDKPAILFEDRTISYRELHRRANRTASWLQSSGIEKGDRVAVLLENCPEFIELYLACARLGAIFVPLNFRLMPMEIDYLIKHSGPRLLVFSHKFQETVDALQLSSYRPPLLVAIVGGPEKSAIFENYREDTESFDGQTPFVTSSMGPADPEEPHVIMYTSGTTGRPKGCCPEPPKNVFQLLECRDILSIII